MIQIYFHKFLSYVLSWVLPLLSDLINIIKHTSLSVSSRFKVHFCH